MQRETVARLRAGTVLDPYSNEPVLAWEIDDDQTWETEPTEAGIETLAPAEPRPSGEPLQDARNQVTSGWTLYLPEAADITRLDRVRVRGIVYKVMGDPASWLGAGLVVQTELSEG